MKREKKYWPQIKAETGRFITHIEIEVTVHYTFSPAERMTRDYPGSPACVDIDAVVYGNHELPLIVAEDYEDELIQEAWDDLKEKEDGNMLCKL